MCNIFCQLNCVIQYMKRKISVGKSRLVLHQPKILQNSTNYQNTDVMVKGITPVRIHSTLKLNRHTTGSSSSIPRKQENVKSNQHNFDNKSKVRVTSINQNNYSIVNNSVYDRNNICEPQNSNITKQVWQEIKQSLINHVVKVIKEKDKDYQSDEVIQNSYNNIIGLLQDFQTKLTLNMQKSQTTKYKRSTSINYFPKSKPTKLALFQVYSENFLYQQKKKLILNSQAVNYSIKHQLQTNQSEMFKSTDKKKIQSRNLKEFTILINRLQYLDSKVLDYQNINQHYSMELQDLEGQISKKHKEIQHLQTQIQRKNKELTEINSKHKQFEDYINHQPNQFLIEQAFSYKKTQQELFDLAFMLEQSTPQKINLWIGNINNITDKSFHLTLASFVQKYKKQGNQNSVGRKEVLQFKSNIQSCYNRAIGRLEEIVESRLKKIKQFVGIMQRLASLTVNKRLFIDRINEAMTVSFFKINKSFHHIERILFEKNNYQKDSKIINESLSQLQILINNIKESHMKCNVFY